MDWWNPLPLRTNEKKADECIASVNMGGHRHPDEDYSDDQNAGDEERSKPVFRLWAKQRAYWQTPTTDRCSR